MPKNYTTGADKPSNEMLNRQLKEVMCSIIYKEILR